MEIKPGLTLKNTRPEPVIVHNTSCTRCRNAGRLFLTHYPPYEVAWEITCTSGSKRY